MSRLLENHASLKDARSTGRLPESFPKGFVATNEHLKSTFVASSLLATVVEEACGEIIVFDGETFDLVFVNRRARQNLGYSAEELQGMKVLSIKAGGTPHLKEILHSLKDDDSRTSLHTAHARKDGSLYPIDERSQARMIGGRKFIFQTIVDQTDASRLDAQAELLSCIELDAAVVSSANDFLRAVLRRTSRYLECAAAHAYVWSRDTETLLSIGLWHFDLPEPEVSALRERVESTKVQSGFGVTGRVHAEKTSIVQLMVNERSQLETKSPEPQLAIPILAGQEVEAVLEFYSERSLHPDRLLHGICDKISTLASRLYERKRAEENLAEMRDRLEAAMSGANVGLWDYNHRNGKSYLSERCKEILGFTHVSPVDWKGYLDRVHPEDVEAKISAMTAHAVTFVPYDVEYRVIGPTGDYIWVHARGRGVWDEEGNIVRSVGTLEDVTAKKDAEFLRHEIMSIMAANGPIEEKIAASLDRACRYLKLTIGVVSHINEDRLEILYSNSTRYEVTKRGATMPLAQAICSDIFLRDDVSAFPNLSLTPLKNHPGRLVFNVETYIGTPFFVNGARFGTLCFVSQEARPNAFLETELAMVRLLALWIGEQIGRESYIARLVENDLRKTANLASVGDAVLTLTETGIVDDANPAAAALFGIDEKTLCGMHIAKLLPSAPSFMRPGGRLAPVNARQDIAVHSDGHRIAVVLHISEVRLADRTVYAVALTDWTAVRQAETAKREFVSVVSHELRTPLTSIRGALGLIAAQTTGPLTPATANLVQIAQKNSERLVKLVNDILDVEKLESGKFELDLRPVDLAVLLQDAVMANTSYAARFGVTFDLSVEPDMPPVLADDSRLLQIMANLLSNAAKFTRPCTSVSVEALSNGSFARILVRDRGQGIPNSLRRNLFEKFVQGDNSNTREREGSGLGLCISRQLATLMNGDIGLVSSNHEGSVFFFEVPFVDNAPTQSGETHRKDLNTYAVRG